MSRSFNRFIVISTVSSLFSTAHFRAFLWPPLRQSDDLIAHVSIFGTIRARKRDSFQAPRFLLFIGSRGSAHSNLKTILKSKSASAMADGDQPSGSRIAISLKEKLREKLRKKSETREEPIETILSRLKLIFEKKFVDAGTANNLVLREERLENGKTFLELKRRFADIIDVSNGGPLHSARGVIDENGTATFQVLHKPHCSIDLLGENNVVDDEAVKDLMDLFEPHYFCCIGLRHDEFEEISRNIHVELKNKEELKYPFERITSKKCLHWFKAGKNISKEQKANGATCGECKNFYRYVRRMKVRNEQESTGSHFQSRLKATSNFAISKLTPKSKRRRILASSWQRAEQRKKLRMYEEKLKEFDVELDESQNSDMESVVAWINRNAVNDLESLLAECENQDISDAVRNKWYKDTEDRAQFYRDQFCNQG